MFSMAHPIETLCRHISSNGVARCSHKYSFGVRKLAFFQMHIVNVCLVRWLCERKGGEFGLREEGSLGGWRG